MFIVRAGAEYIECSTRVETNETIRDLAHDYSIDGYRVNQPRTVRKLNPGASVTVAVARSKRDTVEIRVQRTS